MSSNARRLLAALGAALLPIVAGLVLLWQTDIEAERWRGEATGLSYAGLVLPELVGLARDGNLPEAIDPSLGEVAGIAAPRLGTGALQAAYESLRSELASGAFPAAARHAAAALVERIHAASGLASEWSDNPAARSLVDVPQAANAAPLVPALLGASRYAASVSPTEAGRVGSALDDFRRAAAVEGLPAWAEQARYAQAVQDFAAAVETAIAALGDPVRRADIDWGGLDALHDGFQTAALELGRSAEARMRQVLEGQVGGAGFRMLVGSGVAAILALGLGIWVHRSLGPRRPAARKDRKRDEFEPGRRQVDVDLTESGSASGKLIRLRSWAFIMRLRSLSLKVALLSIGSLAVIFAIGMFLLVGRVSDTIGAQTRAFQAETTESISRQVMQYLDAAEGAAEGLVTSLEAMRGSGVTDRAVYDAVIRRFLEENPDLLGTWSGWEPNALDGNDAAHANAAGHDASGRYVPYWNRGGGQIAVEPLIDYDKEGPGDYYQLPKKLGRAVAIEPYMYAIGGKDVLIMSFGLPITVDGKYVGTGGVDVSLAELNARLSTLKPFETGHVELISSSGIVVASPHAAHVGKPLDAGDPIQAVVGKALAGELAELDALSETGVAERSIAVPFNVGGTEDRWVIVSSVPVATLEAAVAEGRWTVAVTSVLCVLLAGAVLFALIRLMVGRPLGRLGATVDTMAGGNYEVAIEGTSRVDEIGKLARALEVFRDNGKKVAAMTDAEAARIVADQQARSAMMHELQQAFGQVVDSAVAGDFGKRVETEFPDPELNAIATSINNLVATVDRGLGETGQVLAALAETDLTQRVQGDYEGAFARLKTDTNRVADKLGEIVGQLKETSRSLKTATSEILSGANDLSERTTKQAATIEETSAAMEQLAQTVLHNAERAKQASQVAGTVTRTAEEGGAVMTDANEAMERISNSSSKISNIIGLIDDIAFQTNLLALNASVEAARAGDAGKGFAVVAVEVRRLAQSAASASSEVKVLIEQSGVEVKTGSRLVADAAARLTAMVESARSSSGLMDGIAKESREQASSIEEVNTAVRQLDEATQHNAALVEEINAAIEQTEAQASELDRIVDIFNTSATAPARTPAAQAPRGGIRALQDKVKTAARSYLSRGNAAVDRDWSEF
ncbi:methyl-accepting chemotaxis protein [Devosia sp.]|uniref:methyl-accepting chemotaxis protein n=1 Tax=Devosia sp. TaxID=1871048 RepID=UPI0035B27B35